MKQPILIHYILPFFYAIVLISQAHADTLPEYKIKAAYLYNFALLATWPEQAKSEHFNLCILGQDNFGSELNLIQGKVIDNKPIQILRITNTSSAKKCRLVFIGHTNPYQTTSLINELTDLPILTITDETSLENSGAMIVLYPENQRIVFDINLNVAKQANINLSSRLLRLAKRVTSP